MNAALLKQWMEHPELLNRDTLYELRMQVARYPYFQTLRLLLLKNLYLLHDPSFHEELRHAALLVADRRVFFYLIEGDRYRLHPQKRGAKPADSFATEEEEDRTLALINAFLSTVPDEEQTTPIGMDYAMDYTSYLLTQPDAEETTGAEEETSVNEEPDAREATDAGEEPSAEEASAEEATSAEEESVSHSSSNEIRLIDNFLNNYGHAEASSTVEISESEVQGPPPTAYEGENGCFTETLAKIYVKQHRYEKALEIFKRISLNNPKKSAYFADQIRFLEKLIINTKTKK